MRVGHQFTVGAWNFLGQRGEDVFTGQLDLAGLLGVGQDDSVITDLYFDDVLDTVRTTFLLLGLLDRAGGIGDIGMLDANTGAEQLQSAAGTGGLDFRGLELGGFTELLGNHGGERVHG